MIHWYATAGFLMAILPVIATPGAGMTLLVQHVTTGGRRRAVPVILGTATGLYAHATLAVAGLSALIMHSAQAFTVVKLAGAAYLVGLGVWTWHTATRPRPHQSAGRPAPPESAGPPPPASTGPPPPASADRPGRARSVYVQAVLANVLNPKAASIYLTLVPQFVVPGPSVAGQILGLATVHAALMAVWSLTWTALLHRGAHLVREARFRRVVGRVSAVVLVALGVRAATA
ncbi:LysE family translocator [Nonomuraea fuscirosea]|uniref:LysE family translocator n=1 Tax=Nonomuraea fuscirosea TaxID=1291556 RepID=UPI0033F1BD7D